MSRIWDDIEIEWQGDTYTVRPTMEFINRIQQKDGMSISKLFVRARNGDLPSGAACELIAAALQYAGADVSAEEVFEETGGGIDKTAVSLAVKIMLACMPKPKDPAPLSTGDGKKKSSSRKPTGGKSTA